MVTYIELAQGMRNKQELIALRRALRFWNVTKLYIPEDISAKAMLYAEHHYLSHSIQLADALMSATAVAKGLDIFTGNVKHSNHKGPFNKTNEASLNNENPLP